MFKPNPNVYRIYISTPAQHARDGHLVGEFDDKIAAEAYFAEALRVHVAEIAKGVTRVSLIAK